jgi:multiple sugar transport system substrate-binding protein
MKKLICFALVLILLSSLSLFASGGKETQEKATEQKMDIVVLCHKVHQKALEGYEGGGKNLVDGFMKEYPNVTDVKFITAGTPEVHDKLFREVALPRTDIDVSLIYTPHISGKVPKLMAALDEHMKAEPVEDLDDIFQNLRNDLIFGGETYGLPMRAGGNAMFFNRGILKERGIGEKFDTIEQVVEAMYKCTFVRPNGDEVYGYAKQGRKSEIPFTMGIWLRTKDGDIMTENLELKVTDSRVIEAVELHKKLFDDKVLPPNFTALANKDVIDLIKGKRTTFGFTGPDYGTRFVGDDGLTWDEVGYINTPPAEAYKSQFPEAAPTMTFQWAFVVPGNAKNVRMSWNFIRHMSSKEGVLNQALSGNNPVRASVYDMPEYKEGVRFVEVTRNIFKYGRKLFPGFDSFAEVRDMIGEEMQRVVLGEKTARAAMADAERKAKPMIK